MPESPSLSGFLYFPKLYTLRKHAGRGFTGRALFYSQKKMIMKISDIPKFYELDRELQRLEKIQYHIDQFEEKSKAKPGFVLNLDSYGSYHVTDYLQAEALFEFVKVSLQKDINRVKREIMLL